MKLVGSVHATNVVVYKSTAIKVFDIMLRDQESRRNKAKE
jgi:hypothetical protein